MVFLYYLKIPDPPLPKVQNKVTIMFSYLLVCPTSSIPSFLLTTLLITPLRIIRVRGLVIRGQSLTWDVKIVVHSHFRPNNAGRLVKVAAPSLKGHRPLRPLMMTMVMPIIDLEFVSVKVTGLHYTVS